MGEQRPANEDEVGWKTYWEGQRQFWRTEPEIDSEKQKYLEQRRNITADIKQGIYPFKDISLSRADVEWLLITHENGRGPLDWIDPGQRTRKGLDLRGAILIGVDLRELPLAGIEGGTVNDKSIITTSEQRAKAAIHLEGANLTDAHLEGAILSRARLEGANLRRAHLEEARLYYAHLEGANLRAAHLEGAFLGNAYLNGKDMKEEELKHLHQWKENLEFPIILEPTNLRFAFLDRRTNLDSAILGEKKHGFVSVVDVRWGDANLALVNWFRVEMLGDEYKARQRKTSDGKKKSRDTRRREYRRATRANRQLANVLRGQGLNEEADYFARRSQILNRKYLWQQVIQQQVKSNPLLVRTEVRRVRFGIRVQRLLSYIFSWFLFLIAGYGYRARYSIVWYLLTIFAFAIAYSHFGHIPMFPDAIVFSLTSFHGRGFFPGLRQETSLHNPLIVLAAFEAVIGLFIEISFIATFTQRFLGN